MATFKERDAQRIELYHELAVWEHLYRYLDETFIQKDGRDVKAIVAPGRAKFINGEPDERVQDDTLDQILQDIESGPMKGLKDRIAKIENEE